MTAVMRSLILMMILVVVLCLLAAAVMLLERKLQAKMQGRLGPRNAGPLGIGQPVADTIKLLFKENLSISTGDSLLYRFAPVLALAGCLSLASLIPFGTHLSGVRTSLVLADINVGLLYLFVFSLTSGYAVLLAGWTSRSPHGLLSGVQAALETMSCDIPLVVACAGVLMQSGSLSLVTLVEMQAEQGWFAYRTQGLGCFVFLSCCVIKCCRSPFDQSSVSGGLAAGCLREYSGMKYGLFRLSGSVGMIVMSALAVNLFFGGWVPLPWAGAPKGPVLLGPVWFWLKVCGCCFLFIWLKASLPRLRPDQIVSLCWRVLLPLSLINTVVTAVVVTW